MFDQFITIMMNDFQTGPPPATESAINDLPVLKLTKETAAKYGVCSICYEDFAESEEIITLPCSHSYHQYCVTTWLKHVSFFNDLCSNAKNWVLFLSFTLILY